IRFFQSVVRTPEAPSGVGPEGRFMLVKGEKFNVNVERKWLMDMRNSELSGRILVRGILYDKIIAMIMTTSRGLGFPKYAEAGLRISYPEVEQLLMRKSVK